MRRYLSVLFLGFASALFAQISVIDERADIVFFFNGDEVKGTVKGFNSDIQLDFKNLSQSKVSGTVDVKTLETGIGLRDKHLYTKSYFNAAEFPKMTFVSEQLLDKGDHILVKGKLTIKDITKPVIFELKMEKSNLVLATTINTADYDVMTKKDREKTRVDISITVPFE